MGLLERIADRIADRIAGRVESRVDALTLAIEARAHSMDRKAAAQVLARRRWPVTEPAVAAAAPEANHAPRRSNWRDPWASR